MWVQAFSLYRSSAAPRETDYEQTTLSDNNFCRDRGVALTGRALPLSPLYGHARRGEREKHLLLLFRFRNRRVHFHLTGGGSGTADMAGPERRRRVSLFRQR